jgi:K(+)-stimulated pyrophosphate-energized sodium pump
MADKSIDGYKQIGDVLFYKSHVPAVVDPGLRAVDVTQAHIGDFVSAYSLSLFNPILLAGCLNTILRAEES